MLYTAYEPHLSFVFHFSYTFPSMELTPGQRSKKIEAERKRRTRSLRDAAAEPVLQPSFPLGQDMYIPPPAPSLLWRDFRAQIGYLSPQDKELVKKAFEMGDKAHGNQKRISGDPYFTHCIAVALLLTRVQADAETLVLALLHDAVEDTHLQLADIVEAFGPAVAHLVDGVTKLDRDELSHSPAHKQHIETIRKIFTYMQEDIRIIVVKLYDRLHNMQTIGVLRPDKQRRVALETLQVYAKVAAQLCMKQVRDDLEYLSLRVLEPQKMLQGQLLHEQRLEETRRVIEHLRGLMQPESALHISLEYYPVSLRWVRLMKHLEDGKELSPVPLSIVIVVPSIEDCYRTLYLLHRLWQRESLSFDDFINSPRGNGYQGLHTTVILQDGRRVRCMIRTKKMDTYAGKGIRPPRRDAPAIGRPGAGIEPPARPRCRRVSARC